MNLIYWCEGRRIYIGHSNPKSVSSSGKHEGGKVSFSQSSRAEDTSVFIWCPITLVNLFNRPPREIPTSIQLIQSQHYCTFNKDEFCKSSGTNLILPETKTTSHLNDKISNWSEIPWTTYMIVLKSVSRFSWYCYCSVTFTQKRKEKKHLRIGELLGLGCHGYSCQSNNK